MKKKLFPMLLAFLLVFSAFSVTSMAAGGYTVAYNPGDTAAIPLEEFGDDWREMDMATYSIDGIDGTFSGRFDFWNDQLNIEMPCNIDIKKGVYPLTFTFSSSMTGQKCVSEGKVWLEVSEDTAGCHLLNSAVTVNGNSDVVLRFDAGTGKSRITSIGEIGFFAKMGAPEGNYVNGFSIGSEVFSCDLEKGEIVIPKEYFRSRVEEFGWQLLPYVYFGGISSCTLANGKEIVNVNIVDNPVPNEDFVNDGGNGWYLIFSDLECGIALPEEVNLCPETSKEIEFRLTAPDDAVVAFESSDDTVASVSKDGTITGVAPGKAKITAVVEYNGTVAARGVLNVSVGHSLEKAAAKAPTCTEDGHIEHYKCSRCGKLFSDESGKSELTKEDIIAEKTGHAELELKGAKAATCTSEGYTGDEICKACGAVVKKGEAIEMTGHSYKDGKCTVCGASDPDSEAVTPPPSDTAEEKDPDVPKTGDKSNILWLAAAAAVSLTGTAVVAMSKRKTN